MPRVISGSARGTHLSAPRGDLTRPTADRVKEALFSILTPALPADGFLDLYAGTGQIGLEAASRGSRPVVLVEQARPSLEIIKTNLAKTHLTGEVALLAGNVFTVVSRLVSEGRRFEIIFMDPPYKAALSDFNRLAPELEILMPDNGILVLEHDSGNTAPPFVTNLQLNRSCQYGMAMLSFYQKHLGEQSVHSAIPGPD
ncbi:MAG: 16S rRNA (guanine(966)-N(2))-methyltransferase RsmD [Clostridiaceae bacterium]|nr:16S rRNA (guanine(966)-N(2))-methyltransferase RsmD [Clostridiaceae bacterium]